MMPALHLHLHLHLHRNRPDGGGWQRLVALAAIGTFMLTALPWLGLTPTQPQPSTPVQVMVVGSAPSGLVASPSTVVALPSRPAKPTSQLGPQRHRAFNVRQTSRSVSARRLLEKAESTAFGCQCLQALAYGSVPRAADGSPLVYLSARRVCLRLCLSPATAIM